MTVVAPPASRLWSGQRLSSAPALQPCRHLHCSHAGTCIAAMLLDCGLCASSPDVCKPVMHCSRHDCHSGSCCPQQPAWTSCRLCHPGGLTLGGLLLLVGSSSCNLMSTILCKALNVRNLTSAGLAPTQLSCTQKVWNGPWQLQVHPERALHISFSQVCPILSLGLEDLATETGQRTLQQCCCQATHEMDKMLLQISKHASHT